MSDEQASRLPTVVAKARPLWRPLDSMRASMVKQVFSREHFTHKKGLLFTPTVHLEEHPSEGATSPANDAALHDSDDAEHAHSSHPEQAAEAENPTIDLEALRAQAFEEGLAQGLAQAQQQALHNQAVNEQEALAAQTAAHTQALLQELASKVDGLVEDPSQLQEPLKRLALHLAEQLVLTELSLSPQAIDHLIERCMETLDASDTSAIVVELNAQDLALLQNQQRAEGQPKPAWRLQADPLLLPGSVRVRADDAVVSDLIENRLESLAHSLLTDPQAWQSHSSFAPSKMASRLAAQRGSARTVEDAQAKPQAMPSASAPASPSPSPSAASVTQDHDDWHASPLSHDAHEDAKDDVHEDAAAEDEEKHTYEAHEVMNVAPVSPEAMTAQFHETLNDITLELDKHND